MEQQIPRKSLNCKLQLHGDISRSLVLDRCFQSAKILKKISRVESGPPCKFHVESSIVETVIWVPMRGAEKISKLNWSKRLVNDYRYTPADGLRNESKPENNTCIGKGFTVFSSDRID